jgi:hypothetical protein
MKATYRYSGSDRFSSDRSVTVDESTALWLARMCFGESGADCTTNQISAMVWSMLHRFFLHPARSKWVTLTFLIRRFSQPINPRWSEGGDLAIKYAGTKYTTPSKMERRKHIQGLQWNDMPWHIEDTIDRFRKGLLPPPETLQQIEKRRISNWASHHDMKKKFPWGLSFGDLNWFFEDRKLINGTVVIDYWR